MTLPPTTPEIPRYSSSSAVASRSISQGKSVLRTYGFIALVMAGVLVRLLLVVIADNRLNAPWGGVGDAPAYVLLAQNLATGKGYAYAGHPTAYRAPVYPFVLAASMKLFGRHVFEAIRLGQFLMGLLIAYLCASVSGIVFGEKVKKATLIIALFFPTLIVMTGEILTETSATLMSAIFLYLLVRFLEKPNWIVLTGLSAIVGFATLVRFNMALFGFVALGMVLFQQKGLPKWRGAALTILLPALIISPWLIRNYIVFHGALVLSTEGGPTAAMGVLAPQGRALPGDSERLLGALGWLPPAELETNNPSRDRLGDEAGLNGQAWKVTFGLWRETGWRLVPLTLEKLSYFWLSTDQLLWTGSFRPVVRAARSAGVLFYWVLLALGIAGWFKLRALRPELAYILLFYAILVTILHVPFNMNTRLRMPFIDPWLAVLGGAGLLWAAERMEFQFLRGGHGK